MDQLKVLVSWSHPRHFLDDLSFTAIAPERRDYHQKPLTEVTMDLDLEKAHDAAALVFPG